MNEYIKRATLKERFQKRLIWLEKDVHDEYSKGLFHGCETDMGLIDEIPTADVVEVVRCKNCFYYKPFGECNNIGSTVKPYDYCSYGARMDKDDEIYG